MPKLSTHQSSEFVKVLYLGDSGTGKTGSLVSLVEAGYELRVLDFDNGLDILAAFIKEQCPTRLDAVDFETRRDKYKGGPAGPIVDGAPKAFAESMRLLNKWPDGSIPAEWGPNTVFVIDSLTGTGRAAFEWAKGMNPMAKEPRQWYNSAQQAVDQLLSLITSEPFRCNVIVIAHVQLVEDKHTGAIRGYANSIGKALGPLIPTYFNNMILAHTVGVGKNAKRSITTVPTSLLDLKSSAPFKVEAELPLGTGLATLFKQLKGK
jgi:AAA domain